MDREKELKKQTDRNSIGKSQRKFTITKPKLTERERDIDRERMSKRERLRWIEIVKRKKQINKFRHKNKQRVRQKE